jgi:hypothetical protein
VLRWILAIIGIGYGLSLLVMRDRWMAFFERIDNRERNIPVWFPLLLAGGAFFWAFLILVVL